MITIHGQDVDHAGRCRHWHQDNDIVANCCATCQTYYACYVCHDAMISDHVMTPVPLTQVAVLCGACGYHMTGLKYQSVNMCPDCHHPFNPNCHTHTEHYFLKNE